MIVADRIAPSPSRLNPLDATPLQSGARVDVCIVGTGLAGMIAGYLLAREGHSVMVLDDGPAGGAHGSLEATRLASVIEQPYARLEAEKGPEVARTAAKGCALAIDTLEAIVRRERIPCEFERLDGYAVAGPQDGTSVVEGEFEAASRAGIEGVELLPRPPIEGARWGPCVRYAGQAQLHPTKLLAGLARAIRREGGRIHGKVNARCVEPGPRTTLVTTDDHRIEARTLITSHPVRPDGRLEAAPAPHIAHVVGLHVARGSVARALYWECGAAARWVHVRSHGSGAGEVLLVGGEDPTGEDEDHTAYRYLALEAWARECFPCTGDVVERFTGQVAPAHDVFAFAAHADCDSESLYVATRGWGTALTRDTLAALTLKDFVAGAGMPWGELYVPEAGFAIPATPAGAASRRAVERTL